MRGFGWWVGAWTVELAAEVVEVGKLGALPKGPRVPRRRGFESRKSRCWAVAQKGSAGGLMKMSLRRWFGGDMY
jgi:hypothetical protein